MPQYQGIWTLQDAARLQSQQQWATDPLFDYTTLLLQADNAPNAAQNNTFLDSSANAFTITRNGNTTQGTFTPFSATGWSNYFDGSGDYLYTNSNVSIGTSVFTIELWVYVPDGAADKVFLSLNGGTTDRFYFGVLSSTLVFRYNGVSDVSSGQSLPSNQWNHVAVVREGTGSNQTKLYLNGVSVGTGTVSTNYATDAINIGTGRTRGSNDFSGYISNARLVIGTALYTSNFTPSTTPLTAVSGTSLLTCQSNRFRDASTNNFTLTPSGTPSVQAFAPFAPQFQYTPTVIGGSGYFDGNASTALVCSNATAFDFSTGDFTIECWAYTPSQIGSFTMICATEGVNQYWAFGTLGSGGMTMYAGSSGTDIYSGLASNPPLNQWNHLVWQRSSGVASMYLNGTRVYNASYTADFGSTATGLRIGQSASYANYYAVGNICDLRVVKGTGVYSGATITVPTAPLTAVANTQLLLNFTNAAITDGTMKNNLETVGNAQVSTSIVKYGAGSMAFDGTGDYLRIQPSDLLATWFNSDYTIEYWVYPNAFASSANGGSNVYSQSEPGLTSEYFSFGPRASGVVVWYYYNGAVQIVTSGTISTGVWTHLAWTYQKSSNTMRIFINGVLNTTTTIAGTPSISTTANPILVGASTTVGFNGYIDDLRITKGIARYTANFTPPQVALPRQ